MDPEEIQEAANGKTKDGLPKSAFAYTPSDDPSTWKLPYRKADGSIDEGRLPAAVAALSPGGFRGEKADIPPKAIAGVKAKLRKAYKQWKGNNAEVPATLREAVELTEATVLLNGSASHAQVVHCPSCHDMLVIPSYSGEFDSQERLQDRDSDSGLAASDYGEAQALAILQEAGKRNAAGDQRLIQSIHDQAGKLGANCASMIAEALVDPESQAETVKFAEGAGDETVMVTLREASPVFDEKKREIWITPIRPGFGNKKDGFYYTKEALKEAVQKGLFNNRKMYANHPPRGEEHKMPERSVWDWVSTLKETTWDEVRDEPRSRVKVYDDRFWSRAQEAADEIAFSIRGGGLARPGTAEGRQAKIVESVAQIASVDWVTEAGAGGAIAFAESAHEEFEMDLEKLTLEQLKEARPDLVEKLQEHAHAGDGGEAKTDARDKESEAANTDASTEATGTDAAASDEDADDTQAAGADENANPDAAKSDAAADSDSTKEPVTAATETKTEVKSQEAATDPAIIALQESVAALTKQIQERDLRDAIAENKKSTAQLISEKINGTTLPAVAKGQIQGRFAEATVGEGFAFASQDALIEALEKDIEQTAELISSLTGSKVRGIPAPATQTEGLKTPMQLAEARLSERFGEETVPNYSAFAENDPAAPEEGAAVASVGMGESAQSALERLSARMGGEA